MYLRTELVAKITYINTYCKHSNYQNCLTVCTNDHQFLLESEYSELFVVNLIVDLGGNHFEWVEDGDVPIQ